MVTYVFMRLEARILAAAAIAVSVAACNARPEQNANTTPASAVLARPPTPTVPSIEIPSRSATPVEGLSLFQQILVDAARRQGISEAPREIALWKAFDFQKLNMSEEELHGEEVQQEAQRRVPAVLGLMLDSQNPHLQTAARFLAELIEDKKVTFLFAPTLISQDEEKVAMSVEATEREEVVQWVLYISLDDVLNKSDIFSLAFKFAHEAEHIRNSQAFLATFPDLSAQKLVAKDKERITTRPQSCLEEEMRGYAEEARAYRYHYGLGYRGRSGSAQEGQAVAFTVLGDRVDHPKWESFIKDLRASHCFAY